MRCFQSLCFVFGALFVAHGCAGIPVKPEQHCAASQGEQKLACYEALAASTSEGGQCSALFSEEPPPCMSAQMTEARGALSDKDRRAIAAGKKTLKVVCANYEAGEDDGRALNLTVIERQQQYDQPVVRRLSAQTLSYKTKLALYYRLASGIDGSLGLDRLRQPLRSAVEYRSASCAINDYVQEQQAAKAAQAQEEAARQKEQAAEERRHAEDAENRELQRMKRVQEWQKGALRQCTSDWDSKACDAPVGAADKGDVERCQSECASAIEVSMNAAREAATATCSEGYSTSKKKALQACALAARSSDASASKALGDLETMCRAECPAQAKELKRIAREEARQARAAEKEAKRIQKLHKNAARCMKPCMKAVFKCQERRSYAMCQGIGASMASCSKKCCGASGNCSCGGYGRGRACGL
ncbi:MAG: hypothetical protein ACPGU1_06990 [Myxococcota bacterium]